MSKRPFQLYKGACHNDAVKRALPTASARTRRDIANATARQEHGVTNTVHLLVTERLPLDKHGVERQWTFFDPVMLVQYFLDNCKEFANLYAERLRANPGPWRMQVGMDEQTPGSKVNHDNRRKNMVICFNFLELGHDVLECDATWFIPVVVREEVYKHLHGGWSVPLRIFMRRLLLGPRSFTCAGALVTFSTEVAPVTQGCLQLQARLSVALTDGEGLMKCLQWNGHGSLRPDFVNSNVFKKNGGMADEGLGYVEITCSDSTRIREWSDDAWHKNIDDVLACRQERAAGRITQTRLNQTITAAGFCPTADGLLADLELRAQNNFLQLWQYDSMHTAFQDGFMSQAMWLIVKIVSRVKYNNQRCESLVSYLNRCQFPMARSSQGRALVRVFTPLMLNKHEGHNALVANASVQFTLYPLIKDWALLEAHGEPSLSEHLVVYLAACRIVDILKLIKHRRLSTFDAKPQLVQAHDEWFTLHKALYGILYVKPKHEWMGTIAKRIDATEWLFDMFYIERQHRRVRVQAEMVKNMTNWESAVLMRVVDAQVTALQVEDPLRSSYRLVGKGTQRPEGAVTTRCVCGGAELSRNDIVQNALDGAAGVVLECILGLDSVLRLRVEILRNVERGVWEQTPRQTLWLARDVFHPTAWRQRDDGLIAMIE